MQKGKKCLPETDFNPLIEELKKIPLFRENQSQNYTNYLPKIFNIEFSRNQYAFRYVTNKDDNDRSHDDDQLKNEYRSIDYTLNKLYGDSWWKGHYNFKKIDIDSYLTRRIQASSAA